MEPTHCIIDISISSRFQKKEEAGKELWRLLVLEYAGRQISATLLTAIAYWATLSGSIGVEDLAVDPNLAHKDRNDYLKLAIGKHYKDPDLFYCKAQVGYHKLHS